jgi:hypothetical protein
MKSTINEYVLAFLEEHGSADMIAKWNDEENQDSLEEMIPKTKTTKAKKTKDPNAPKKAKSAYMFFCADKREEAKKEAEDHKQVLSILGSMWTELKENVEEGDKKSKKEMEKYTKQAEKDKERYNEEMETYEPPTTESDDDDKPKGKGKAKGKAKKDPNAPKKPKSAYLIFCADKREEAKEELGEGAAPKDILTHLGTMWAEAKQDPDEFNKYQELAEKDKERYKEEMGESEKAESEDKPKKAKATKAKSDSESDSEEDKPKKAKATKAKSDSEEDKPKKAKATKAKSDSEEDKPKKKMNAYVLFSKENRAQVKEENPDMDSKAVTKELAQQWKDLDDDEKQEWKDKADELNDK